MANFKTALALTLPHEGGFSNDPKDKGAFTYMGISRKYYPNWAGWEIIDRHLPLNWNQKIIDPKLDSLVEAFYLKEKWRKLSGVNLQKVANQIFDFTVNSGKGAKIVQKCLGLPEKQIDGIIGNNTIAAINRAGIALNDEIRAARIAYLRSLVAVDPSQAKFLKGWLDRANSF